MMGSTPTPTPTSTSAPLLEGQGQGLQALILDEEGYIVKIDETDPRFPKQTQFPPTPKQQQKPHRHPSHPHPHTNPNPNPNPPTSTASNANSSEYDADDENLETESGDMTMNLNLLDFHLHQPNQNLSLHLNPEFSFPPLANGVGGLVQKQKKDHGQIYSLFDLGFEKDEFGEGGGTGEEFEDFEEYDEEEEAAFKRDELEDMGLKVPSGLKLNLKSERVCKVSVSSSGNPLLESYQRFFNFNESGAGAGADDDDRDASKSGSDGKMRMRPTRGRELSSSSSNQSHIPGPMTVLELRDYLVYLNRLLPLPRQKKMSMSTTKNLKFDIDRNGAEGGNISNVSNVSNVSRVSASASALAIPLDPSEQLWLILNRAGVGDPIFRLRWSVKRSLYTCHCEMPSVLLKLKGSKVARAQGQTMYEARESAADKLIHFLIKVVERLIPVFTRYPKMDEERMQHRQHRHHQHQHQKNQNQAQTEMEIPSKNESQDQTETAQTELKIEVEQQLQVNQLDPVLNVVGVKRKFEEFKEQDENDNDNEQEDYEDEQSESDSEKESESDEIKTKIENLELEFRKLNLSED